MSLDLPENLDMNEQSMAIDVAAKLNEYEKATLSVDAVIVGQTKRTFTKYAVNTQFQFF